MLGFRVGLRFRVRVRVTARIWVRCRMLHAWLRFELGCFLGTPVGVRAD